VIGKFQICLARIKPDSLVYAWSNGWRGGAFESLDASSAWSRISGGLRATWTEVGPDRVQIADNSGAIQRTITAPCKGGRLTNSCSMGLGAPRRVR
jgi:hypothetical protein